MNKKNYKILAADDEYWIRENLRTILDWKEYSLDFLEPAVDGEDVLNKMEKECPDILITDINMPFINGVELVNIIKTRYPNVITIILSGYSDFNYVKDALLAGSIDYILKPLSKIDLINTLAKALEVISKKDSLELERISIKEELLKASSILRDKELSMLIAKDELNSNGNINIYQTSDLELGIIGFSLVLIKITDLSSILKNKFNFNHSLFSYAVKNIIDEITKEGKSIIFNNIYASNEFILISDLDNSKLDKACNNIIKSLEDFLGVSVNIAISSFYYSVEKIRKAYNEALSVLMCRTYCPGSSIMHVNETKKITAKKRLTAEDENRLIYAVQAKNKNLIKQLIFNKIGLKKCHTNTWLFIEVKQTVNSITRIIIDNVTKDKLPLEILAMENLIVLLDSTLESFNISEVCSLTEQIIDECFEMTDGYTENDTTKHTVKLVIDYINENYFEELSLNFLSKLFLIDSSYLSKLFKKQTGDNLMLYIAKKRIEKAIELIKKGDISLTDISSLVGYDDYVYFNRVFRKITGKSPREFKYDQNLKQENIL